MSTVESVLFFIISALLLTTAAIHGFVVVMTYLDKRADEKQKDAENLDIQNRRN